MDYTTQQLNNIMVGNFLEEGWAAKSDAVVRRFQESAVFNAIDLEAQEDYCSYIELFCHKKEQDPDSPARRVFHNGISVLLSNYVPVAVYGASHYTKTSHTIMVSSSVYILPPGGWANEIKEIESILREFGVPLLSKEYLVQKIPFEPPDYLNIDNHDMFEIFFNWWD